MSGAHSHKVPENLDSKLKLGLLLNTGFTVFEFALGFLSGSLALISDAAHNLTDSMSLAISYTANKIADRDGNVEKTYGYGRATILAALINTLILFGLAFYIFYEAYQRILYPEPVVGKLVAMVALVGIIINGSVAALFYKSRGDLNMKSAFLSMFFDMLASVGALIAGLIIMFTDLTIVDPLMSILIGLMLIMSAWGVGKEAIHILLDGVPEGIDVQKVKEAILNVSGVHALDDLHVWALSTRKAALSCHLVIQDCRLEEGVGLVSVVKKMLHDNFRIDHVTIETQLRKGPHDKERINEGM